MSNTLVNSTKTPARQYRDPAFPKRLWMPVALTVLYLAGLVIMNSIDKLYFIGFMYGMASAALMTLLFFAWWFTNRTIKLRDRFSALFVLFMGGILVAPICHASINVFSLATMGLPLVLIVCTVWLMAVRRFPSLKSPSLWTALVMLTWSLFADFRVEGLDGNLQAQTHWRWTPTAEERFLAEKGRSSTVPLAGAADWKPTVTAADWPEFRGLDRDGVIRDATISTDWKTHPPRLIWKQKVGPAWSSVIIVDNRLFTQEQRGEKEIVVCYDATSGKEIWAHEDTVRFWESVSGAGPRATPTFVSGRLYTQGGTGLLNCLDAATGLCYWSQNIATDAGTTPPMWGYSSSPLVAQGMVIAFSGGKGEKNLLGYRADTGELAWTAPAGENSYSSPQLTTLDGVPQCIILSDHGLTSIDPSTGSILWKEGQPWPGAPRVTQPRRIDSSKMVIGPLDAFGISLIDVKRDNNNWKVTRLWDSRDMKPEFPDFVMHNGHLYGFDVNIFCCIDLATGKRTWKAGRYGRGQVILLSEQSLLMVVSENGELVLLKANPQKHEELGKFQAIEGKTWAHPVIARGKVFVRNAEEMACFNLSP